MDAIIKALYQIRKEQVVQFFRLNPEKSQIPPSFAYALSHDCYPYFHSEEDFDVFNKCFFVDKVFFEAVAKYIDEEWIKKIYHSFYELEDHFGHERRMELITILRYCYLDHRFDDVFWEKLEASCPCEAHGISRPLQSWEI